jgi:hypothetical protein
MHKWELHNLCPLPNIIKKIKSRGDEIGRAGAKTGAYRAFVEKPERKRPLERSRCS